MLLGTYHMGTCLGPQGLAPNPLVFVKDLNDIYPTMKSISLVGYNGLLTSDGPTSLHIFLVGLLDNPDSS